MRLDTPRSEQGQMVVCSYGWHDGAYYRRTVDRSDRSVVWHRAEDPSEIPDEYNAGGAIDAPEVSSWIECDAPDEDA